MSPVFRRSYRDAFAKVGVDIEAAHRRWMRHLVGPRRAHQLEQDAEARRQNLHQIRKRPPK